MREPGRGKIRAARGLAMSAACLLVPTAAHVSAGGAAPVQLEFFLAAALLSVACVALADRRRNPAEIGGMLVLSQLPLHVLLTLAGHDHIAGGVNGVTVALAHLAAAAVLTVLLSGAEAVIWAFAALSTTVLFARVRRLLGGLPAASQAGRMPNVPDDAQSPGTRFIASSAPRRGPPASALA